MKQNHGMRALVGKLDVILAAAREDLRKTNEVLKRREERLGES